MRNGMREKLIKFFEEYKELFKEGMSSGDADDVLMNLIGIISEKDIDEILNNLKNNFYC